MEILQKYLENKNIKDLSTIIDKFNLYYSLLKEWNEKINLTNIIEKDDVQVKHFIDSLLGLELINDNTSICDVGAGAGFPSIPLAILNPTVNFVLIDSVNKKVNFLNDVITKLNLNNCKAYHSRIEDFCNSNRESFDYCVARGVASLPTLLEYTIPLLKVKGQLLAYKASKINEEIEISKNALKCLNSSIIKNYEYNLSNGDYRCILKVEKNSKTNTKYPRGKNLPRLSPL